MRKSKFVNPSQRCAQSSFELSPNKSQTNNPLIQNKIFYPVSFVDKLMPYKLQCSSPIKSKTDKMYSSELYGVKEKNRSQEKRQKRSGFKRENKFEKAKAQPTIDNLQNRSKSLIKNNTMELKKLPGISCTASGTTIYRSKNIKSLGKFVFERSLTKRGKPQLRRNLSVRNEESIDSSILSNKKTTLKSKDNKAFLYQTYFSSKPSLNQRSNSQTPIFHELFCQDSKQEIVENAQDQLCKSLIQTELYGGFDRQVQQQFF